MASTCKSMSAANLHNPRDTKDLEQKKVLQEELKDLRAQILALGNGLPLDEAGFLLGWVVYCSCT